MNLFMDQFNVKSYLETTILTLETIINFVSCSDNKPDWYQTGVDLVKLYQTKLTNHQRQDSAKSSESLSGNSSEQTKIDDDGSKTVDKELTYLRESLKIEFNDHDLELLKLLLLINSTKK